MSFASDTGTLHLLIGQHDGRLPRTMLPQLGPEDTLILLQDAVWLALPGAVDCWAQLPQLAQIFVLQADLQLRGLDGHKLHPRVHSADDEAWVAASERHARSMTWGAD